MANQMNRADWSECADLNRGPPPPEDKAPTSNQGVIEGYCGECAECSRPDMTTASHLTRVAARFWSKVDPDRGDGCWPWRSAHNGRYGKFSWQGRPKSAHRIAWILAFGEVPAGAEVCHRCDVPLLAKAGHAR